MVTLILIVAFLMGLTFGSLVATNATRMKTAHDRKRIGDGISVCDHCGERLSWHDTIAVFSYFRLRGRCRHCDEQIPPWTLWAELGGGVLFVVGTWLTGQLGWWG